MGPPFFRGLATIALRDVEGSRPPLEIGLMLAREAGGLLGVAGGDRVEDGPVAFRDGVHVDVRLQERLPRVELDRERFPEPEEKLVVGRSHDRPVEPDAMVHARFEIAVARRGTHAIEMLPEDADIAFEPARREAGGGLLEGATDDIDLALGAGVIVVDE